MGHPVQAAVFQVVRLHSNNYFLTTDAKENIIMLFVYFHDRSCELNLELETHTHACIIWYILYCIMYIHLSLGQVQTGGKVTSLLSDHVAVTFESSFEVNKLRWRESSTDTFRFTE